MFQHQGVWLPDGEEHFPYWMTRHGELINGKGTYQIKKLRAAMQHTKNFGVAVDVGAHVGLWSMHLVKQFLQVHAFEPVEKFRACFQRNVTDKNCQLYPVALGEQRGRVVMEIPLTATGGLDSGGTHVKMTVHAEENSVQMLALDEYDFERVDFIKIDCEGYEHHVIAGARETIMRCRPAIIVEQKPHKLGPNFGIKGTPAVDLLKLMGAKVVVEMGGDFILTFG